MRNRKGLITISLLVTLGVMLASCQPQVVEVEKVVISEKEVPVEIEKIVEVEKIVKEVEVKEVEVEVEKIVEVEVEKIVEVEVEVEAEPVTSYAPSGEVVIAVGIEPISLGAWRGFSETGCPGCRSVTEQLVLRNYDNGSMMPSLATSWERIDDSRVRFYLREGVNFTDGSPFNAEMAAVSINHSMSAESGGTLADYLGGEMSAEAVDEYTLDIFTADPDPMILQKMDWVSIGSGQQLLERLDTYDTEIIGTGPYMLDEWKAGESISFVGNPDWWGNSSPEGLGAVSFEKATYRFLAEDTVRAATVKAGEAHIAQYVTPDDCKDLESNSGTHCDLEASVETMFIRPDTHGASLFSDIRLRRALLHAIDRQLIVDTILGGAATVASQICNPSCAGHNPDLAPVVYDPDYAKFLIAEAQADGIDTSAEIRLVARIAVIPQIAEVMPAIQEMVNAVGFNAVVEFMDPDAFGKALVLNWKDTPEDRNLVGVHLHGNEILDWATSYRFYMSCDGILSVMCDEEAERLWEEALPLTGEARVKKMQASNLRVVDQALIGHVAHMDLAYGISDDLDWKVNLDHRILLRTMKPAR